MKTREDIIKEAIHECFKEMYAKAQPSIDYDELLEKFRNGEITEGKGETPIHDRYYLSMDEFTYIRDKYLNIYRMNNLWKSNVNFLRDNLTNGSHKDVYIPERTDENGDWHPGYRSSEEVPNLKDQFRNILNDKFKLGDVLREPIAEELYNAVIETIDNCRDFYRFDREEEQFGYATALGASPCSNKKTVIDYWKSQGVELKIEDRNPLLLWEMDYYGDEFEEVMEDEYGDDWETDWWERYETEKQAKTARKQAELKELMKNFPQDSSLAQNLQVEEEKGGNDEQL
jgi:hypothetical protein